MVLTHEGQDTQGHKARTICSWLCAAACLGLILLILPSSFPGLAFHVMATLTAETESAGRQMWDLPFKRQVAEFPVSLDARLPLGFEVTSAHYVPGQTVDVVGWTKWKGFQGVCACLRARESA
eukprot:61721-Pelagomonas_calceolata.AAC.3